MLLSLSLSCLMVCNDNTVGLTAVCTPEKSFCVFVLIGCTISVRNPSIFTFCMGCTRILRVVRFVMKYKSVITLLEKRSDLLQAVPTLSICRSFCRSYRCRIPMRVSNPAAVCALILQLRTTITRISPEFR
jgi:hypothetical protein